MTAKTGMPAAAMAAAAWSCVEKMLQEAQRTSAPSAFSVSISTAVWIVMCSEPVMRAPFSGLSVAEFLAAGHQARHFGFGDVDFLAAPVGKRDIGDDDSPCAMLMAVLHAWSWSNVCGCGRAAGMAHRSARMCRR